MNIIRQLIAKARAIYTRFRRRREAARRAHLQRYYTERERARHARPSLQDQHAQACITAYAAKRQLVKEGKGKNTLNGIPNHA